MEAQGQELNYTAVGMSVTQFIYQSIWAEFSDSYPELKETGKMYEVYILQ